MNDTCIYSIKIAIFSVQRYLCSSFGGFLNQNMHTFDISAMKINEGEIFQVDFIHTLSYFTWKNPQEQKLIFKEIYNAVCLLDIIFHLAVTRGLLQKKIQVDITFL